jgi:hypothetical protein
MRLKWREPMIVWCRLRGPKGAARELRALIDHNYHYCLILRQDAIDLGYPETSYRHGGWYEFRPDRAPLVVTFRGIERTILINLTEISVGKLRARNVPTVVLEYDVPPMAPVDVILGLTFLEKFRITIDPESGVMSLIGSVSQETSHRQ